nr:crotonase/enoyl-CoA hydratase family protein [Erythrobacter sp.]
DPAYGGQGMPAMLQKIVGEMAASACFGFSMYPGLSGSALNALHASASDEQKAKFLPKMTSGEWTGTMNLTEPQCGTDLGLIRTRAVPQPDGSYKITGQKIWISGGEHDLTENIIHLVLARIEGAPDGVKGISLFIVPKVMVNDDGTLGERNGVSCGGLEEKMGCHGNSTCVMNYDDATGYLVGEENKGLRGMFVMMNEARIGAGMLGYALAEPAYQNALAFALDRRQGRALNRKMDPEEPADNILVHPDVRRMLLDIRAFIEGARTFGCWMSLMMDVKEHSPDEEARARADDYLALLTPVMKAYFTDKGLKATIDSQQVLGGSGYVEEWGMSQFVRDVRIASIWEGTNGVQALDLVGRKLPAAGGRYWQRYFAELDEVVEECGAVEGLSDYAAALKTSKDRLADATQWIATNGMDNPNNAAGVSSDYLHLFGVTAMAHMWLLSAKAALKADAESDPFIARKLATAQFFFERVLPESRSLHSKVKAGSGSVMANDHTFWPHETGSLTEIGKDYRMGQERGVVRTETEGHVLKIIIDNPEKKNSFVPEMMYELSEALTELDKNDDLWVGVLCAVGDHFTAGLDMPKFFGPTAKPLEIPEGNIDPFGLKSICSKPIVTAVQGITFTVGIEMMLAGDIAIAADSARFCQMEAKRGIAPLGGAHFRYITRAGWGDAMYHLMLCDEFTADEAKRIGLVQEVVPHGSQVDRAMEVAQIIAKNAPLGIQITKKAGRQFIDHGEKAAIAIAPEIQKAVMTSEDMMEGIQSFMERREAVFKGR